MSVPMYRVFKYMGQGYWTLYNNKFKSHEMAKLFVARITRNARQRYRIVLEEDLNKEAF
jgi:hypothetical protein